MTLMIASQVKSLPLGHLYSARWHSIVSSRDCRKRKMWEPLMSNLAYKSCLIRARRGQERRVQDLFLAGFNNLSSTNRRNRISQIWETERDRAKTHFSRCSKREPLTRGRGSPQGTRLRYNDVYSSITKHMTRKSQANSATILTLLRWLQKRRNQSSRLQDKLGTEENKNHNKIKQE